MRNTLPAFRAFGMALMLAYATLLASVGLAVSAENSIEQVWQETITGQIEAFRRGDGESALGFAGSAFQVQYRDRDALSFIEDLKRAGYTPIIDSQSHSFGDYRQVEGEIVLQVVNLQGPDQGLYKALYQLRAEADGWRIQSVRLRREPGLAI